MDLEHGQGRARRMAMLIATDVGVKGTRDGRKRRELPAMARRTSQGVDKAAAVGVSRSIHARLIHAVIVLDTIDQVRREDLVADVGIGVSRSLPSVLRVVFFTSDLLLS